MSWSFSVTEKNSKDAEREFDNKLMENEVVIPNAINNALASAGHALLYNAKSNQQCTLSSNGHFNADGSGSASVACIIGPAVINDAPDGLTLTGKLVDLDGKPVETQPL